MRFIRPRILSSFAALGLFALVTMAGDSADAVTKLHDPVLGNVTTVYGDTNGNGIHRGPWVVQIAVAKGEQIVVYASPVDQLTMAPTMRAIAGNGSIYLGHPYFPATTTYTCFTVPVSGWVTVHVDVPGLSEQRIKFEYSRKAPGFCTSFPPH
jgi:hypothetical protein